MSGEEEKTGEHWQYNNLDEFMQEKQAADKLIVADAMGVLEGDVPHAVVPDVGVKKDTGFLDEQKLAHLEKLPKDQQNTQLDQLFPTEEGAQEEKAS